MAPASKTNFFKTKTGVLYPYLGVNNILLLSPNKCKQSISALKKYLKSELFFTF